MNKSEIISRKSVIYVNFAPYENAGKILDYIFSQFELVVVFSFNFHKLTNNNEPSLLKVYQNQKLIYKHPLYYIPTPSKFAFILLPIRSLIIYLQLFYHVTKIKHKFGIIDVYFTVNAFTAWCGNTLRKFGLVKKTIFWVWDYYPPVNKNSVVKFMRWLYWQYDKSATLESDRVVFLNNKLHQLRKDRGIIDKNFAFPIVEIGTDPIKKINTMPLKQIHLVFLGVVKNSQGLDLFFESAKYISRNFPSLSLDIIGSGPDEFKYKEIAKNSNIQVNFHGYIADEAEVDRIISYSHIGIATYLPEKSNVSYFSDPSKIKRYLSQGKPVITTNVFDFSKEITSTNSGIVIRYDSREFIKAIKNVVKNYAHMEKNALNLSKKYYYKKIYTVLLNNLS
jgi:glycosyltransferase involved in cell wall biosynthesis